MQENSRLVVDDVIYLKDEKDESSVDYRLSEALSGGCDGPRWVGENRSPIRGSPFATDYAGTDSIGLIALSRLAQPIRISMKIQVLSDFMAINPWFL